MASDRELSPGPHDRMGVYKRVEDVPDRYRLRHHAGTYAGRDVWEGCLAEYLFRDYPDANEQFYEAARRAGRRWTEHMERRGRHHALATPADVNAWCEVLFDGRTIETAYTQCRVRIEGLRTS